MHWQFNYDLDWDSLKDKDVKSNADFLFQNASLASTPILENYLLKTSLFEVPIFFTNAILTEIFLLTQNPMLFGNLFFTHFPPINLDFY